jgi:hypothetical protein
MNVGIQTVMTVTALICLLVFGGVSVTQAQTLPTHSHGDLTVSVARMDFDLSGLGNAPAFAVRMTRDLSSHVSLEFGGVYSKPRQQFGPSTLFIPEAQLRYRWGAGRVSPYVGGGGGMALVKSPFHSDWDPAVSVAGGAGVRVTGRLSLNGELRVRAHEWSFTGVTSEVSAGLTWKLPRL